LELCPGSYNAEKGLPESTSEFAEEGKMLHGIVERLICEQLVLNDNSIKDLTSEQLSTVLKCKTFMEEICQANAEKETFIFASEMHLESNVTAGTADVVIIYNDDTAVLVDWKFGRGEVEEAINNIQLATYALLLKCLHPELTAITVYVYQPRLNSKTSYTYTDLDAIALYVNDIIAKCNVAGATRMVGGKQCLYCKANGLFERCPESCNVAMELATHEIDIDDKLAVATPEKLVELYNACKLVAVIEKKTNARIKEIIQQTGSCGDLTLVQTQGNREVTDIALLYQELKDVIPQDEFLGMCKLPVGAVEDMFSRKAKDVGVVKTLIDGKKMFSDRAGEFIGRGNPIEKIVRKKE
jgi:hypothetical protein